MPTQMYSDLDVLHGKMARPYNDALSVVGKPSGLRSVSWDYQHYCGRRSATGQRYPNDCDGMIGSVAAAKRVFGDSGPVFMMRLLMPSSSLSNMVEIRGTLAKNPAPTAEQHLVVIALHDELLIAAGATGAGPERPTHAGPDWRTATSTAAAVAT